MEQWSNGNERNMGKDQPRTSFPRYSPKAGDARMFGIYSRNRCWYVLFVLNGVEIWDWAFYQAIWEGFAGASAGGLRRVRASVFYCLTGKGIALSVLTACRSLVL